MSFWSSAFFQQQGAATNHGRLARGVATPSIEEKAGQKSLLVAMLSITLVLASSGCAPVQVRLDDYAKHLGFQRGIVQSDEFDHVFYGNAKPISDEPVHVYVDGDGSPWIDGKWIARDPTPQSNLVLKLMGLDSSQAVYLGRPCYHGFSMKPPCAPPLWTHQRYSEGVVNSLAGALKELRNARAFTKIILIGYSGGGTLAMLLAERVPGVRGVITLAGNLAVADWTRLHGYSPLSGSLDPSSRTPLHPQIMQLHIAGGRDSNVPPRLTKPALKRQPAAQLIIFDGYTHTCCWEELWPSILKSIQRRQNQEMGN